MLSTIIKFLEGLFKLTTVIVPVSVSTSWDTKAGTINITLSYNNIPAIEAEILNVFISILKSMENVVNVTVSNATIVIQAKI